MSYLAPTLPGVVSKRKHQKDLMAKRDRKVAQGILSALTVLSAFYLAALCWALST